MRLIRLQTDHDDCLFDNSLDDDILIQPGAKIALQNACIIKTPDTVTIGHGDNTIKFKITAGGSEYTVHLNTETYTRDNYTTLLHDIRDKMNAALDITVSRQVGIQWGCFIKDNKVVIEYKQPLKAALYQTINLGLLLHNNVLIGSQAKNKLVNGTNPQPNGSQFMYVQAPVTKGCGSFTAQMNALTATGTNTGFIFGLVERQSNPTAISLSDYKVGIKVPGLGTGTDSNLLKVVNGAGTSSTAKAAVGDYVGIEIYQDKAHLILYKTAAKTLLQSVSLVVGEDYYPAITFFDATGTKLQQIQVMLDPFATPSVNTLTSASSSIAYAPSHFHLPDGNPWSRLSGGTAYTENFYSDNVGAVATYRRLTSGGDTQYWQQTGATTWNIYFALPTSVSVPDNTATIDPVTHIFSFPSAATTFVPTTLLSTVDSTTPLAASPPSQNRTASIHSLTFGSRLLSDFLRFTNLTYSEMVKFAHFAAESMFDITDTADSFVVEMLSLELDSYNSIDTPTEKSGGRRSILATVPKTEGDNGTIIYEVNYPTFIDIRNKNPVAIRNIRARILKSDLTPLRITGTATMTLLIDN